MEQRMVQLNEEKNEKKKKNTSRLKVTFDIQ